VDFLHYDFHVASGQAVEISLDTQANVKLMSASDFHNYQSGRDHRYYGGRQVKRVGHIVPPHAGHWHLTIDLGGGSGSIRHSVRVV
jgi:hypothetical protein